MNKILKYILVFTIPVSIFIMFIFLHESVHQQIYSAFGIDSKMGMNYTEDFAFVEPNATQFGNLCATDSTSCLELKKLNAYNEIFSYNIEPFLILFLVSFELWIINMPED